MQKLYIELKQKEQELIERLLRVNEYEYFIYTHDEDVVITIDIECYQLTTIISILREYMKNNSTQMNVYAAMNINILDNQKGEL